MRVVQTIGQQAQTVRIGGHGVEQADGRVEHEADGEAEEQHRGEKASHVSVDGQLDHLLDRIEVGIVEVAQEPEYARPQDLAQHEHERGEVEDVDHADEPVDEGGRAGRLLERGHALPERGVEQRQRAHVEPRAAHQRKHAYLEDDEQRHLDHDEADADELARAIEGARDDHGRVDGGEQHGEHCVADDDGHQALEVGRVDQSAQIEARDRVVADVVRTEGEYHDEQCVQRDHPEHVLEKEQRAVEAKQLQATTTTTKCE